MYKTINLKINTTSVDTKYEVSIELLFDNYEYVDMDHRMGAIRKMGSYTFRFYEDLPISDQAIIFFYVLLKIDESLAILL